MKAKKVTFPCPITVVGGGALDQVMLSEACALAPRLIAADGAADRLATWGLMPEMVIGDMDSVTDLAHWQAVTQVVHLPEQDTTDFEKCLYATDAPLYLGAGFTGRRVDHMLAVFHALLHYPDKRVVLLGEVEVMALIPAGVTLSLILEKGAVVSLYPLLPSAGITSDGLKWPIDGLAMAPGQAIGTSNEAVTDNISVQFSTAGVLIMLERRFLRALTNGLLSAG